MGIPRGILRVGSNHTIRYHIPQMLKAWAIGLEHPTYELMPEQRTVSARMVSNRTVEVIHNSGPAADRIAGVGTVGRISGWNRDAIGRHVHSAGMVMAADGEVMDDVEISITVETRAPVWPDIAGVTTEPWRMFDRERLRIPDLYRWATEACARITGRGGFEHALMVHDDEDREIFLRYNRSWAESVSRIIVSERVRPGEVWVGYRVGAQRG